MPNYFALLSLGLFVLASDAEAQILVLKDPIRSHASPSTRSARAPSDDAVRAFALSFEDAIRRGARDEALALFDHAALVDRATKSIPATEKVKKAFREGARQAWSSDAGPVGSVLAAVAGGGTLRWLRNGDQDGERTVVFRLTRADASAPEYLEIVLAPRGDKSATAVDANSSADGASHAHVLRRWLLALVADAGRTLPERIAGEDRAFALAGRTFETIDLAFESGRSQDALNAWGQLSEDVRRDPAVVLARLRAALAAGTQYFDAALAQVREAKDPNTNVELFAVDVAMATNRPTDALVAIDELVGAGTVDPYLDALRGSILRDLDRDEEARSACRRAVSADPQLEEGYWTLLGLAIEDARHEEALTILTSMDERFEIDWRGLADSPAYQAFLESKPGSRWRAKVAARR